MAHLCRQLVQLHHDVPCGIETTELAYTGADSETLEARLFLTVGVLGGFTTFSAFGYETMLLLRANDFLRAGLNAGVNVFAGLLLVWVGFALTTR
jgi:protein CrcB